jgi:hypothetical protein
LTKKLTRNFCFTARDAAAFKNITNQTAFIPKMAALTKKQELTENKCEILFYC